MTAPVFCTETKREPKSSEKSNITEIWWARSTKKIEAELSQEHLPELAGVHRTYIGMIERAEKNITLENIEKIADALKVKPEDLLRFE